MSGRFLLDTNIVIGLFADDAAVKDSLAQADEVFIASIVIGELCYGAQKSGRTEANIENLGVVHLGGSVSLQFDTRSRHAHVPVAVESPPHVGVRHSSWCAYSSRIVKIVRR